MTVHGISLPLGPQGPRWAQAPRPAAARDPRLLPSGRAPESALSGVAAPPAGVNPELWAALTPDERAFFLELGGLGELSYSPATRGADLPAPRGSRIDVRV